MDVDVDVDVDEGHLRIREHEKLEHDADAGAGPGTRGRQAQRSRRRRGGGLLIIWDVRAAYGYGLQARSTGTYYGQAPRPSGQWSAVNGHGQRLTISVSVFDVIWSDSRTRSLGQDDRDTYTVRPTTLTVSQDSVVNVIPGPVRCNGEIAVVRAGTGWAADRC